MISEVHIDGSVIIILETFVYLNNSVIDNFVWGETILIIEEIRINLNRQFSFDLDGHWLQIERQSESDCEYMD